jgi:hypothetical protein
VLWRATLIVASSRDGGLQFRERGVERLGGEGGGVVFAGGESADGLGDSGAGDAGGLFERHAFEHFGEGGAAGEGGRAAVGEKARGLDAAAAQAEGEPEAVAADGVRLLGVGVRVGERAGVARVREVVFEGFGVGQGLQAGVQARSPSAFW